MKEKDNENVLKEKGDAHEEMLKRFTWCWPLILSNSSIQQDPWSASTKAPASRVYSFPFVLESLVKVTVNPELVVELPQT